MVHATSSILTQAKYLQIANATSEHPDNVSHQNQVTFPEIQSVLFNKVSPLHYKTRVHLSFSLTEEFRRHFVLIKGLIEFYRSKNFSFEYNAVQKGIEADIEVSQLSNLQLFFDSILSRLNDELKFKETLKIILDFENRYKLAQAEVYALFVKATSRIKEG